MANSFNRYLKVYRQFAINSILEDMEYRASFFFNNLSGLLWMVGSLFFINVIFTQASSVGGWDKNRIILLYLTFSINTDFFYMFIRMSLERFSRLIQEGTLDGFLLKPINLRFLVSFITGRISFNVIFRLIIASGMLVYYNSVFSPSVLNWLGYIFLNLLGLVSIYSFMFIFHTLNIWFVRLDNLTHFSFTTMELAKVPLTSWPKLVQALLTYVFPIAILSTFSVQALIKEASPIIFIISPLIALLSLTVSQIFWNFALRHYSSASS